MSADAHAVLRRIEEAAGEEYLPIVGREQGEFLEGLVRDHRPCRIVEVGVLVGYATIHLARALDEGCHLIGIEIAEDLAQRARQNLQDAGLDGKAEVRRGDAAVLLKDVPAPVGMVVLDGPRSSYLSQLRAVLPSLREGAIVAAHLAGERKEVYAPYLEHVRSDEHYRSENRQFGDDAWEVTQIVRAR